MTPHCRKTVCQLVAEQSAQPTASRDAFSAPESARGVKLPELTSLADLPIGAQLGRYELLEILGTGGSGVVRRARDVVLRRSVAIKVLDLDTSDNPHAALQAEAMVLARLRHEHIVGVYDFDVIRGLPFIAMEYLEGNTLEELLGRSRLQPSRAVQIAMQITSALISLHEVEVLHLDLKPSNVFITLDGSVKLLDFGVCSSPYPEGVDTPEPRTARGTPSYMAPEQWGIGIVDERADVWGVGGLLFEMLSGRPSLEGWSRCPWLNNSSTTVPSLSGAHNLPQEVDTVIERTLTRHPERRFSGARELMAALRRLQLLLCAREVANTPLVDRRVAAAAGLLGSRFRTVDVQTLTEMDHEPLLVALDGLVRADVVRRDPIREGEFRLCSAAFPSACLSALSCDARLAMLERLQAFAAEH